MKLKEAEAGVGVSAEDLKKQQEEDEAAAEEIVVDWFENGRWAGHKSRYSLDTLGPGYTQHAVFVARVCPYCVCVCIRSMYRRARM